MPKPRNKTTSRRIKQDVYGVAERLRDAPPSDYVYRGHGKPDGKTVYEVDGVVHTFDGGCHPACPDVR